MTLCETYRGCGFQETPLWGAMGCRWLDREKGGRKMAGLSRRGRKVRVDSAPSVAFPREKGK